MRPALRPAKPFSLLAFSWLSSLRVPIDNIDSPSGLFWLWVRLMKILEFMRGPSFILSFPFVGKFFLFLFILKAVAESIPPIVTDRGFSISPLRLFSIYCPNSSSDFFFCPLLSNCYSRNFSYDLDPLKYCEYCGVPGVGGAMGLLGACELESESDRARLSVLFLLTKLSDRSER